MQKKTPTVVPYTEGAPDVELRVVLVGDGAVGKTMLLHRLVHGTAPMAWEAAEDVYNPTTFANSTVQWARQEKGVETKIEVDIWDTAGQEALANLRRCTLS